MKMLHLVIYVSSKSMHSLVPYKRFLGSTFLCLKIFLCFQISQIMVNHIPFQLLFCFPFSWIRWKCWKLAHDLLWCNVFAPTHWSHITHTFWLFYSQKKYVWHSLHFLQKARIRHFLQVCIRHFLQVFVY